jgi:hypothetical protein
MKKIKLIFLLIFFFKCLPFSFAYDGVEHSLRFRDPQSLKLDLSKVESFLTKDHSFIFPEDVETIRFINNKEYLRNLKFIKLINGEFVYPGDLDEVKFLPGSNFKVVGGDENSGGG